MTLKTLHFPDLGTDDASVIEVRVLPGQDLQLEQTVMVLESAKATMEVPAPMAGRVVEVLAVLGQSVRTGDAMVVVEAGAVASSGLDLEAALEQATQKLATLEAKIDIKPENILKAPDLGTEAAHVLELMVQPGQVVAREQSVMVLESAKATMEVPSTLMGTVVRWLVQVGDAVVSGQDLLVLQTRAEERGDSSPQPEKAVPTAGTPLTVVRQEPALSVEATTRVHAGPAVRRMARELGVDLARVEGHGPHERILKEDIQAFVRQQLSQTKVASQVTVPLARSVADQETALRRYGEVENQPFSRIQRYSAQHLAHAAAEVVPVTQFDLADITDLEAFRLQEKVALKAQGVNLTLLAFLVRACAHVLQRFPRFNSELRADGEGIFLKHWIHIGVAVDTEGGLVVPVLHDCDRHGITDIARRLGEASVLARDQRLRPEDMAGGCFTISSLGGIGGTAFTPVVNWPQVAILGVSRASLQPVWDGEAFRPRLMLPLSLTYDHRVIDGALAARFTTALAEVLGDVRRLLL
ncbi:MAG: dihydrolipoamide acetyltransferase [Pseudomonadales bacterium]|nr:dihydrolipoamide acetyltransferase [Pseudomonadales bacterium]